MTENFLTFFVVKGEDRHLSVLIEHRRKILHFAVHLCSDGFLWQTVRQTLGNFHWRDLLASYSRTPPSGNVILIIFIISFTKKQGASHPKRDESAEHSRGSTQIDWQNRQPTFSCITRATRRQFSWRCSEVVDSLQLLNGSQPRPFSLESRERKRPPRHCISLWLLIVTHVGASVKTLHEIYIKLFVMCCIKESFF